MMGKKILGIEALWEFPVTEKKWVKVEQTGLGEMIPGDWATMT